MNSSHWQAINAAVWVAATSTLVVASWYEDDPLTLIYVWVIYTGLLAGCLSVILAVDRLGDRLLGAEQSAWLTRLPRRRRAGAGDVTDVAGHR